MKKKKILLFLLVAPLNQFCLETVNFYIKVLDKSVWGVYQKGSINNNQGKAGIVQGTLSGGCLCTPCLEYGVSAWNTKASDNFVCDQNQMQAAQKRKLTGKKNGTVCSSTKNPNKKVISFAHFFSNAENFAANLEKDFKTVIQSFPNYYQGQSPQSNVYLSFAAQYQSQVANQLTIIGDMLVEDIQNYFPEGVVTLALDYTQLAVSESEQKMIEKKQNNLTSNQSNVASQSSNPFGF